MKTVFVFLVAALSLLETRAQGTSCSSPYTIPLNGNTNNYSTSTTTGSNLLCTSWGTSPVTWFTFTANASGECPLLAISTSDNQAFEVMFYSACGSNVTANNMCFYNGTGLFAPSETYTITPNATYYLRIKTTTSCTISIRGSSYTPPNLTCLGATSLGSTAINDNNACHKPGTGVTPAQLCGLTLENTAFYQFYVAASGSAIINISSITCNNGASNNSNGFQVGFFTGECGSFTPLNCNSGSGSFVQATTLPLPAGTKVFVAIDGTNGANCSYSIQGINTLGVLSADQFRKLSVWKQSQSNLLRWATLNDQGAYYVIERSENGVQFHPAGQVNKQAATGGEVNYSFEDLHPPKKAYYRVKQVGYNGQVALSHAVYAERTGVITRDVRIVQGEANSIQMQIDLPGREQLAYRIVNLSGQVLQQGQLNCQEGTTYVQKNIGALGSGRYFIQLSTASWQKTVSFIR